MTSVSSVYAEEGLATPPLPPEPVVVSQKTEETAKQQEAANCSACQSSVAENSKQQPYYVPQAPRSGSKIPARPVVRQNGNGERNVIDCPNLNDLFDPEKPNSFKPLSSLSIDISVVPSGNSMAVPVDCASKILDELNLPEVPIDHSRGWAHSDYHWVAPGVAHKPLYFEDAPLERYGQTISPALQPVISGVRFFAGVPLLPYKMALEHPHDLQYDLGYYRPGSCAPMVRQRYPLTLKGITVESAVVAGLILLIP